MKIKVSWKKQILCLLEEVDVILCSVLQGTQIELSIGVTLGISTMAGKNRIKSWLVLSLIYMKLHWSVCVCFWRTTSSSDLLAVYCSTSRCHHHGCSSGSQFGSLLRHENHKGAGASRSPLISLPDYSVSMDTWLQFPLQSANQRVKTGSRSIALLWRLYPSRRCFIFVSSSSSRQSCSAAYHLFFILFEGRPSRRLSCPLAVIHKISVRVVVVVVGEMRRRGVGTSRWSWSPRREASRDPVTSSAPPLP